mmetsp:Transcript_29813/g.68683  ORF Transcript_29813/g.68683 Transcript_29813/m.68683 type:complete len:274 (-) Transcript_29813:45-866(-)
MNRTRKAQISWWCEFSTAALTIVHSSIVFHDLGVEQEKLRVSDPVWFKDGFCVWSGTTKVLGLQVNSHILSFVADLLLGLPLAVIAYRQTQRRPDLTALRLFAAAAGFTILHGVAHLFIGSMEGKEAVKAIRTNAGWNMTIAMFCAASCLLAIGPYIGYCHKVSMKVLLTVHVLSCLFFVLFMPPEFAFGFVQLYLNFWYCIPRLWKIGCEKQEDVSLRVDGGFAVVSAGFLCCMPPVFLEMLTCENILQPMLGHVVYDGTILLVIAFSLLIL